ncbi:MAG: hypothetical protein M3Z32_01045, partial [Acidobacteriota bacterium]|nr:hypothetical protein [Acidobacteriota bacterium]
MRVDYDRLAPQYDDRYKVGPLQGICDALVNLVRQTQAAQGSRSWLRHGAWLRELRPHAPSLYGLDASLKKDSNLQLALLTDAEYAAG